MTPTLRRASMDDAALLLELANDPTVRGVSVHTEPIAWEGHVQWLTARLASPASLVYVVEEAGQPCGTVRLERMGERAEIAIALAAGTRGRGVGRRAIAAACDAAAEEWTTVDALDAYVRPDNAGSRRAFAAADFTDVGATTRDGVTLRHLVKAVSRG